MRREFNVLALIKGSEHYIYLYDDDSRGCLVDAFRDHAADPQLSLSWFDAAVLTEKVKEQTAGGRAAHGDSPASRLPIEDV